MTGYPDLAIGRAVCGCPYCENPDNACDRARGMAKISRAFFLANRQREPGFMGWLRWAWWTERCTSCPRRVPVVGRVFGLPARKRLRAVCDRCLPLDLYDLPRAGWVTEPWLSG